MVPYIKMSTKPGKKKTNLRQTTAKKAVAKRAPAKAKVTPKAKVVEPDIKHLRFRIKRVNYAFIIIVGALLIVGALTYEYILANDQRNSQQQLDAVSLTNQASETHLFYTKRLQPLMAKLETFKVAQAKAGVVVVSPITIDSAVKTIRTNLEQTKLHQASQATTDLSDKLASWQKALNDEIGLTNIKDAQLAIHKSLPVPHQLSVPILIYHQPPADFEQQLLILKQRGYTTITLAQMVAAWSGASLPAKPVVITFDDGFANQMTAFDLLQKYQMKATFYIIDGGAASNWCIGAGRLYGLPSQPATGCGDAYLNWDQIRQLDQSGLITIGSHTIDHPDLATETAAQQRTEIIDGKTQLEQQLGHSVADFAYPYGEYNSTTISIVRQAGFSTAVTTTPGTLQSPSNRYTLTRIRSTYNLP
jgi:peptidoglycan/xylan/chitin deacetylase (PgdA/CDA1 family)